MVLHIRSLGSGSSGNALLVDTGNAAIVIDCGVGVRALANGLAASGRSLRELDAVFLTHEHGDHVRSLPNAVRAGVRLAATAGTARAAGVPSHLWEEVRVGRECRVGGLTITPLRVSHDAAEPCGYHVRTHDSAITVVTDIGCGDEALDEFLVASDLIVLEANHDEAMLRQGPYPTHLKRRVLSDVGHLSNADCGRLLLRALNGTGRSRTIWLAHLSQTNNRPPLARDTVARALAADGTPHEVVPLARHGHEPHWPSGGRPSVAVQMPLLLS